MSAETPSQINETTYAPNTILRPQNFETPDDLHAVWPQPHDAKLDFCEVLRLAFARLGLGDIPISKDGAFTAAQLKNADGASVPYVTVTRAGDVAFRRTLSHLINTFASGDPLLIDPTGIVTPGSGVAVYAEYSNTTIDVTISDTNPHRADQLYIIIKLLIQAARTEFTKIGYLDIKRLNGLDGASVQVDSPTPYLVFTRTLTYAVEFPDYICHVDTLINLVQQTLIPANTLVPDANISTTLNTPMPPGS